MTMDSTTDSAAPSGVEIDAPPGTSASTSPSPPSTWSARHTLRAGHFRLIAAELRDQTDTNAELMHERKWLLHTSEADLQLQGNAFAIENTLDGSGTVFLKIAPLPHARSRPSQWDVRIERGEELSLSQGDGYEWASAHYEGGKWNRIAAAHLLQRARRPRCARRDGLLLQNTWGDRSRDAHLSPDFMLREIEAGARLGVDIIQIDDGWQKGITANSSRASAQGGAQSGAWNGFWSSDPNFWSVHEERFPEGLSPLVQAARLKEMQFGLWFAPDTLSDGANWKRDAQAILRLHREERINFFKIDALKIESVEGEANLQRFFEMVRVQSKGEVTLDLDITAEKRFGFFGAIEAGPLFVENRYTDWRRYWPHLTLRALWQLAHWIDPPRLRMEWLNHARNEDKYAGDPLSPSAWSPDALFATVMFASPLAWFEAQHLPPKYFEQAAPLISTWKEHREAIFSGTMLPIGSAPDGSAWTGFASIAHDRQSAHVLLFRERNASARWQVEVPLLEPRNREAQAQVQVLGGRGQAQVLGGVLHAEVENELGFVWARVALN